MGNGDGTKGKPEPAWARNSPRRDLHAFIQARPLILRKQQPSAISRQPSASSQHAAPQTACSVLYDMHPVFLFPVRTESRNHTRLGITLPGITTALSQCVPSGRRREHLSRRTVHLSICTVHLSAHRSTTVPYAMGQAGDPITRVWPCV